MEIEQEIVEEVQKAIEVKTITEENLEIRDFGEEEVLELRPYVQTNTSNSILRKLFLLTENPIDKAEAYCTIYRIMWSCYDFATLPETKHKLRCLLNPCKPSYDIIYPIILKYKNSEVQFAKHRIMMKIIGCMKNPLYNMQMNRLINAFLVFGEKIELNDINKVFSLDMGTDQGQDIVKQIRDEV